MGEGVLGNGIQLTSVVIGTAIESMENSLFCEYETLQTKPASFAIAMAKGIPPGISDNTFTNLPVTSAGKFTVVLPSETIQGYYVKAWNGCEPFKSMTKVEMQQTFIVQQ